MAEHLEFYEPELNERFGSIFKSDEENFKFAFGLLSSYEEQETEKDDLSLFGTIKARQLTWGLDGKPGFNETDLSIRPCTTENLGIESGKKDLSLFYPPHERSEASLKEYSSVF